MHSPEGTETWTVLRPRNKGRHHRYAGVCRSFQGTRLGAGNPRGRGAGRQRKWCSSYTRGARFSRA